MSYVEHQQLVERVHNHHQRFTEVNKRQQPCYVDYMLRGLIVVNSLLSGLMSSATVAWVKNLFTPCHQEKREKIRIKKGGSATATLPGYHTLSIWLLFYKRKDAALSNVLIIFIL